MRRKEGVHFCTLNCPRLCMSSCVIYYDDIRTAYRELVPKTDPHASFHCSTCATLRSHFLNSRTLFWLAKSAAHLHGYPHRKIYGRSPRPLSRWYIWPCLRPLLWKSALKRGTQVPPVDSKNSTCAKLRGYLSNSWAFILPNYVTFIFYNPKSLNKLCVVTTSCPPSLLVPWI